MLLSVAYRFASGFIKPRGSDTVIAALLAYREVTAAGTQRLRYLAVTSVLPALQGHEITSCFCSD